MNSLLGGTTCGAFGTCARNKNSCSPFDCMAKNVIVQVHIFG
jgi:hypothetical protein